MLINDKNISSWANQSTNEIYFSSNILDHRKIPLIQRISVLCVREQRTSIFFVIKSSNKCTILLESSRTRESKNQCLSRERERERDCSLNKRGRFILHESLPVKCLEAKQFSSLLIIFRSIEFQLSKKER